MRRVLASEPWRYDLFEEDDGSLRLVVLCGTIGLYEVSVTLSDEQVADFDRNGTPALLAMVEAVEGAGTDPWNGPEHPWAR